MKMNLKNNLKIGLVSVFTVGAVAGCANLSEDDYAKANWIKYDTAFKGPIWHAYMSEDFDKSQADWDLYLERVRAYPENEGKIDGQIKVPDLDKSGDVGRSGITDIL